MNARYAAKFGILLLIFVSFTASFLHAESIRQGHIEAELVSDVESVQPGQPFLVGVRFKIDSDWHIYWKNPGDSGIPPKITWNLPPGFTVGDLQWPVPKRIEVATLINYG